MFKCEFSGELSEGAVWQFTETLNENTKHRQRTRKLVRAAEKPVVIVVETRRKTYNNLYTTKKMRKGREEESLASNTSEGFEIVREIRVREKYADQVRKILAEGGTIPRKPLKKNFR